MSDNDNRQFLTSLLAVAREHGLSVICYCLMSNHFHLLLSVGDTPLHVPMQKLLTRYSLYFNHAYEHEGHLFQSRYKAILCRDLGYLLQLVAYIHLNPVRAGLVGSPSDWPWSSHAEFCRMSGSPLSNVAQLAEISGLSPAELRERYLERIEKFRKSPPAVKADLSQLMEMAAASAGIAPSELISGKRGGIYTDAKRRMLAWADSAGYSGVEVAAVLGCTPAALSMLKKRTS